MWEIYVKKRQFFSRLIKNSFCAQISDWDLKYYPKRELKNELTHKKTKKYNYIIVGQLIWSQPRESQIKSKLTQVNHSVNNNYWIQTHLKK